MIAVVVVFFSSWTPYFVYFFLHYYPVGSDVSCITIRWIWLIGKGMIYLPTASNPFIYYKFNPAYRQGFHEFLCCVRHGVY